MILAPSILAADFARLADHAGEALAAGAEWLHVDVMDGHFVPNITMGPLVVRALRPLADAHGAVIDVHLMIAEPERYLAAFGEAGADRLTVHVEATVHLHRAVQMIQALECRAGVAINPATPLTAVEPILPELDQVLVMSVNPGFGGQTFIPASTERVAALKAQLAALDCDAIIGVDGGVTPARAGELAAAGAGFLVAGSAIFGAGESVAARVAAFRGVLAAG